MRVAHLRGWAARGMLSLHGVPQVFWWRFLLIWLAVDSPACVASVTGLLTANMASASAADDRRSGVIIDGCEPVIADSPWVCQINQFLQSGARPSCVASRTIGRAGLSQPAAAGAPPRPCGMARSGVFTAALQAGGIGNIAEHLFFLAAFPLLWPVCQPWPTSSMVKVVYLAVPGFRQAAVSTFSPLT